MCGISGISGYRKDEAKGLLSKMMELLHHRGPDDKGTFIDDRIALGHNRLSIIDISGGHQPMISDSENLVIVFNGEIYNYIELKSEMLSKGHIFKTNSDTEVLLKLYEIDGVKCLDKINGMFAFAIYNKRENSLFIARDRFGIKPCYYSSNNEMFAFASEIKAFLPVLGKNRKINESALMNYLNFQIYLTENTLLNRVKELMPAHYLIFKENKIKIEKYWEPKFSTDFDHNEEYFQDKLGALLEDFVRIHLRSDVWIGSYLSGGIDSGVVTSLATKFNDGLSCYCGRFLEECFDESYYAKIASDNVGADLKIVSIGPDDFVSSIEKLVYSLDVPIAGPGSFPQYIVSQAVSKELKVILGGQGGDEVFGGYTRYLVAYLEQALKGAIFETQEEGNHVVTLNSIVDNLPQLKKYFPMMKNFWADGLFDSMDKRYFRLISRGNGIEKFINSDYHHLIDSAESFSCFKKVFDLPSTPSYLNKMLMFDTRTLLPSLLHVEDISELY
jgi:asparagine synthase (glutamine-hydrolysing)